MTDFDYENLQKKRIAQGAAHRKGGSKSKKCTLPSDLLTEAQRRKLNGPVTSVHLNQPMDWETFKGLSDQLKRVYIRNLRETYDANAKMLSTMFGINATSVGSILKELGFAPGKRGGDYYGSHYKRKMAMWDAFCNGVVGGGDNVPEREEPAAESIEMCEEPAVDSTEKCEEATNEPIETSDAALDELNKSFEAQVDTVDPEDIVPDVYVWRQGSRPDGDHCGGKRMRQKDTLVEYCFGCGAPVHRYPSERKRCERAFCSRSCHMRTLNSELNPTRMTPEVRQKLRDSRLGAGEGKTYTKQFGRHEHRVVAEQILGRPLLPEEVVHHIDGDKRNNSPENIMVFPNQGEHLNWHRQNDSRYRKGGDAE